MGNDRNLSAPDNQWNFRREWGRKYLVEDEILQTQERVLDYGCGPLCIGLPLIQYLDQSKYVGYDIRPECITASIRQVGKYGVASKQPKLVSSLADLPADLRFDVIWCLHTLIHCDDAATDAALLDFKHRLAPTGRVYVNVNLTVNDDSWTGEWQGFPTRFEPLAYYANKFRKFGLKVDQIATMRAIGYPNRLIYNNRRIPVKFIQTMFILYHNYG